MAIFPVRTFNLPWGNCRHTKLQGRCSIGGDIFKTQLPARLPGIRKNFFLAVK
jgi:hypothetical protein